MPVPARPKIYHIVHVDRLPSIIEDDGLLPDDRMVDHQGSGTVIGMSSIKQRRLTELTLNCYQDIYVGQCVPFYFCPRSIMLYLLYRRNSLDLTYSGGQGPIIHLEADLHGTVQWAEENNLRWAFTLSNAGSRYFEDRNDLKDLNEVDWQAVGAKQWGNYKEGKQAEFLVERSFDWSLVERIGVHSQSVANRAMAALNKAEHKPRVEILKQWYY